MYIIALGFCAGIMVNLAKSRRDADQGRGDEI